MHTKNILNRLADFFDSPRGCILKTAIPLLVAAIFVAGGLIWASPDEPKQEPAQNNLNSSRGHAPHIADPNLGSTNTIIF